MNYTFNSQYNIKQIKSSQFDCSTFSYLYGGMGREKKFLQKVYVQFTQKICVKRWGICSSSSKSPLIKQNN